MHAAGAKRGKTRATKSWLVLIQFLIGWKSGASFVDQSQNQSNYQIKLKPL